MTKNERRPETKPGFVYLMANKRNGTLYLGVTSRLEQRAWQHREGLMEGFSKEHGCVKLVWFEAFDDIQEARRRELQMKKWKRGWKLELIEKDNPQWKDLFETLF
ncbi:putative endonuclease [Parasphingorhabdus marina DSM 22363]|uniref:Putative endonuclease n=1 Tax=Parasphingorhabdus marina DSM 22363 TaxID=1123272 RepID=A0A1N6CRF8_9SPHN|nr:GIY-YIG nuclease family protein [Parasphingorhabdus marina]SIN61066.1 putative endonuclease [Parasphingorhabdus marina DSM 22363]